MKKYVFRLLLYLVCMVLMTQVARSQVVRQELVSNWVFRNVKSDKWRPASVPGCVHTDLMKNQAIPDPFFRLNERDLQWIDKVDWAYKTEFSVDTALLGYQHVMLDFKGLDTYAKVYLNGIKIFTANNMFRTWQVDCKELLKASGNELFIEFESPINKVMSAYEALSYHLPAPNDQSEVGGAGDKKVGMFTRKAAYHFGWDWGARLVTSGIWRPIFIEAYNSVKQTDLYAFTRSISASKAEVVALVELWSNETKNVQVDVSLDGKVIKTSTIALQPGTSTHEILLTVPSPRLWWTNGLGKPSMYALKTVVKSGEQTLDSRSSRLGIRMVELVHKPDSAGNSFYFKLNGIPVFMKGANYIPADMFPSRVTSTRYVEVVNAAAKANMNMLRVWGGGIYEDDIFYNLCDEKGILVWQDFMFACALYPGDDAFLENVRLEATDNVRRLRNHPCLALWCGNNEINTAWFGWGWKQDFENQSPALADKLWHDYDTLFNQILPGVIQANDKQRAYWPSLPMATPQDKAPDFSSGDVHFWDVWHGGKSFEDYSSNVGRFMSEYGFQSLPSFASIKQYTQPADYSTESAVMAAHQRHPRGNELIKTYMSYYYNKPKDFESFIYVGQVLQARGLKLAIEAHRCDMPRCMGSLYWQLNDCWPVASWSSTDYYGRWKALHYTVKKAFAPVMVTASVADSVVDIALVSDKLMNWKTTLTCKIIDFGGDVKWERSMPVTFKSNASTRLSLKLDSLELSGKQKRQCLLLITTDPTTLPTDPCVVYFNYPNAIDLPPVKVTSQVSCSGQSCSIRLKTDVLAKDVYIEIPGNGLLSDNYFDMMPGEIKVVEVTNSSVQIAPGDVKIKTLLDTY